MRHLSAEQFVDVAEGHAQPADVLHAERCAACRDEIDQLRRVLALAGRDPIPEPSPLFWEHLSARIGHAVRGEVSVRDRRDSRVRRWLLVPALAALALVAVLVFMPQPAPELDGSVAARGEAPAFSDVTGSDGESGAWFDDAAWALMGELSREVMEADPGAALPAVPGTVDRALGQLSDQERAALVAILQEELSRASDPGTPPLGL